MEWCGRAQKQMKRGQRPKISLWGHMQNILKNKHHCDGKQLQVEPDWSLFALLQGCTGELVKPPVQPCVSPQVKLAACSVESAAGKNKWKTRRDGILTY